MTVLILGSGGLLGSALVNRCLKRSIEVVGTYHSTPPSFDIPLTRNDIRDEESFRTLLHRYSPDVVINCAALTDVDECEASQETAFAINGSAPGHLARNCAAREIPFVHVSTDYIFDGESTVPYTESDPTNPIQVYGRSKCFGEKTAQAAAGSVLLTRLSFVYGVRHDTDTLIGFPSWVRERIQRNETVPLFVDQQMSPTRAGQAAETILDLIEREKEGTYHIASKSCVTPYEFGHKVARLKGANEALIKQSNQADVVRPANRPEYTCLDVTKVENELERPQPTLTEDLRAIEGWL